MDEQSAVRYLQRHYVAWLMSGQWQPERSLPPGMYPEGGQLMLVEWRFDAPCPEQDWQRIEQLLPSTFAPIAQAWTLCTQERAVALLSAPMLDALPQSVMLWTCATAAQEELEHMERPCSHCEISTVCHGFSELPGRTMRELSAWWSACSAIAPQERRQHRKRIQNHLKKGQYGHVAGYVLRTVRLVGSDDAFWSWIPLLMESLYAGQQPSMELLTRHFNFDDLVRTGLPAFSLWLRRTLMEVKSVTVRVDPVERVVSSIQADCSLPYALSNLTESLGLSTAYFSRLFEKRMGIRFSDYLTNARIEHAKQLLQKGQSLDDVSQACGFQRKSYFCAVFRKKTGMTANQYRLTANKED